MKPERLEMVGFAPFRTRVEVDFSDLELFALTGPTGAGKSSVIDAITFALYGVVARYDDKRTVEPIISLGAAETRLRFEFDVAGVSYTAVRLVRRTTGGGATTAEARLECADGVLASGASDVTRAVEALLGLNIDHFTRSVVLPQGEFAAFLHDTPSGQQELVKALLDMGALDDVRRLASERARTAEALAGTARDRLDHLGDATPEAEEKASQGLRQLKSLVDVVAEHEKASVEAATVLADQQKELARLDQVLAALGEVKIPAGVAELSDSLTAVRKREADATSMLEKAATESERLAAESTEVPSLERLNSLESLYQRLTAARKQRSELELPDLASALETASVDAESAKNDLANAEEAWEAARTRHAAHDLVDGFSQGDPCPVCARPLTEDPVDVPPDLDESKAVLSAARERAEATALSLRGAEKSVDRARATDEALATAIGELEDQVAGQPSPTELVRLKQARLELDQRVTEVNRRLIEARNERATAQNELTKLADTEERALRQLGACRDGLAAFGRPPAATEDLAESWEVLVGWCRSESEQVRALRVETSNQLERVQREIERTRAATDELLASAGVTGAGTPTARLSGAVATAGAELGRIRERRKDRLSIESDLKGFEERFDVARTLSNHLRADRFMGWLMAEALATLVAGANDLLGELSQGAYSLVVSDRSMEIVDHRNAEERRSVRSLSGGETFLVSLALALSLGEQLTNLSGGSPLEAIFLDEGFGSLDTETLETVAAVVTELAARGRIVGLVTHVKELAEQVPVRFEIHPGPGGSTIERVTR